MFSASTDSSHKAKSMGESFSPRSGPSNHFRKENSDWAENATDNEAVDDGDELSPTSFARNTHEESFGGSPYDSEQVHLERPRHPLPLIVERSPIHQGVKVQLREVPQSLLAETGRSWEGLSLPLGASNKDAHPWDAQVLLQEAVRYYNSNGPVDVQFAAHLLHKIHILFGSHGDIVSPEECTAVFRMYNDLLLREHMYVEAAEVREFCVGKYPSVYEYSLSDTFINVFCHTCKRMYDNPVKNNLQCFRCKTRQDPCPVCLSLEPPFEWIEMTTKLPSSPADSTGKEYFNKSFTSSNLTDPITLSESDGPGSSLANLSRRRPRGSALWCWCQFCGHGAHVACMKIWLKDVDASEGACPSPGCFHDCGPGIRRNETRATYLEESGRRDSSRKTNSFVVKQDTWGTNESKAVEKVRGMLGSASTGGTTGVPGAGSSSGGTMSPKKVRLVAPGDQDRHKFNGLAENSETYLLKERESTSDPFPSLTENPL